MKLLYIRNILSEITAFHDFNTLSFSVSNIYTFHYLAISYESWFDLYRICPFPILRIANIWSNTSNNEILNTKNYKSELIPWFHRGINGFTADCLNSRINDIL
jgi:hypothetical protein